MSRPVRRTFELRIVESRNTWRWVTSASTVSGSSRRWGPEPLRLQRGNGASPTAVTGTGTHWKSKAFLGLPLAMPRRTEEGISRRSDPSPRIRGFSRRSVVIRTGGMVGTDRGSAASRTRPVRSTQSQTADGPGSPVSRSTTRTGVRTTRAIPAVRITSRLAGRVLRIQSDPRGTT